jgi:uncharacterized protein
MMMNRTNHMPASPLIGPGTEISTAGRWIAPVLALLTLVLEPLLRQLRVLFAFIAAPELASPKGWECHLALKGQHMAPDPVFPGTLVEEVTQIAAAITPVATAVPAFIGYTQFATEAVAGDLTLKPKRIASMLEYERFFGKPQDETVITVAINISTGGGANQKAVASIAESQRSKHVLHYALQMFFANGGRDCYVISVAPHKPVTSALDLAELQAGLAVLEQLDEATLIVAPEAQSLGLADFKTLHDAALAQSEKLHDRFVIMDLHGGGESLSDPDADLLGAVASFRRSGIGTENLRYGAVYAPNLVTNLDYAYDETATDVTVTTDGTPAAAVKLSALRGANEGQYQLCKAAIRELACAMPPSSAVAGVYATVDATRGVWAAPANHALNAVIRPAIQLTETGQAQMNVDAVAGKSVNAIRQFAGRGSLVWGARTLAGNDNEWRYVNIRRYFNFVEESVKRAMAPFVFEPNDANAWVKVQGMIENFLITQWRQGALQGTTPDRAFYVAVGLGKTMTAQDILEGRMIVEIGMAAVRPAEFIVLRITQVMEGWQR